MRSRDPRDDPPRRKPRDEYVARIEDERKAERSAAQDQEDYGNVLAAANSIIAEEFPDKSLPPKFAEDWFWRQYREDSQFRQDIDARYSGPQANARAERAMERKFEREFRAELKSIPDAHATEDKMAVAAAVRGTGGGRTPEPAQPAWSKMSDKEFTGEMNKQFGFAPSRLT